MRPCLYFCISAFLLSACTQQPAPVAMRGSEDFSRNHISLASAELPGLSPSAGTPAQAIPAASAPLAADMSTSSTVSVAHVGVADLAPPQAAPAPKPLAAKPVAVAAPKPAAPKFTAAYIWPVEGGKVLAKFGPAGKGKANDGITIAAAEGEPVYATADGEVAFTGDQLKGYGNMVILKHKGALHSTYAHLGRVSVSRYDHVKQGSIIGYVGSTGKVSGPQLYFAMQQKARPVDPQHYLTSSYAER